jgi:hypothetical protein
MPLKDNTAGVQLRFQRGEVDVGVYRYSIVFGDDLDVGMLAEGDWRDTELEGDQPQLLLAWRALRYTHVSCDSFALKRLF